MCCQSPISPKLVPNFKPETDFRQKKQSQLQVLGFSKNFQPKTDAGCKIKPVSVPKKANIANPNFQSLLVSKYLCT